LVSGGKAAITDVTTKETDLLAVGGSCSSLTLSAKPSKVQAKWQGRNASNKLTTVATDNGTVTSLSTNFVVGAYATQSATIVKPPTAPFFNSTIHSTFAFTDTPAAIQSACNTGLSVVHVSGPVFTS
jgi:hypothetical protein